MRPIPAFGLGLLGLALFLAPCAAKAQFGPPGVGAPNTGPSLSVGGGGGGWGSKPNVRQRNLQGFVRDADGKAIPNAVVYLKNARTNKVQSMITDGSGAYRFGQLELDADYQLWAQVDKKKGPSKTLSSFDTRDQVSLNLKIE
jgi:hypothetical protein